MMKKKKARQITRTNSGILIDKRIDEMEGVAKFFVCGVSKKSGAARFQQAKVSSKK
jgi:hypothetical protein